MSLPPQFEPRYPFCTSVSRGINLPVVLDRRSVQKGRQKECIPRQIKPFEGGANTTVHDCLTFIISLMVGQIDRILTYS